VLSLALGFCRALQSAVGRGAADATVWQHLVATVLVTAVLVVTPTQVEPFAKIAPEFDFRVVVLRVV
jgi:hypothetical protein